MTVDLKQVDTRCIADDSLPWLPLAPYAELVSVKLLSVDPVRGELILVMRASPGVEMPTHRTSGSMTIYTVQGRWKYREHEWVAGPGSLVIEPAATCNTPHVLADGTDDAIVLLMINGDVQMLDGDRNVVGVENCRTAARRYIEHCRNSDIDPQRHLAAHG